MNDEVVVSISCITFNHENYLRECFEGFLMQKCDFKFEVLVHDDASTDNTAKIILEYQAKYPDIFKPLIQRQNQYSQGIRGINAKFNFSRSQGKYIALCEGDDYWTDPFKLQKQVTFLEQNLNYSMCFHNAVLLDENNSSSGLFRPLESREYTAVEILGNWTIPTASVLFRKDKMDFTRCSNPNYIYGDIVMFLTMAEYGKIWCFSEPMSVYRVHPNGMASVKMTTKKLKEIIIHYKEIQNDFSNKYADVLKKEISGCFMFLSLLELKEGKLTFLTPMFRSLMVWPAQFFYNFNSVFVKPSLRKLKLI